jgi:hypothetical protein
MACIGSILLIIILAERLRFGMIVGGLRSHHWSFTRFHLFNVDELRKGMSFPGSTLLIALVERNLFHLIAGVLRSHHWSLTQFPSGLPSDGRAFTSSFGRAIGASIGRGTMGASIGGAKCLAI